MSRTYDNPPRTAFAGAAADQRRLWLDFLSACQVQGALAAREAWPTDEEAGALPGMLNRLPPGFPVKRAVALDLAEALRLLVRALTECTVAHDRGELGEFVMRVARFLDRMLSEDASAAAALSRRITGDGEG